MGRLFWKFFAFILLVQMAGILGTSALFWMEHRRFEARLAAEGRLPPDWRAPAERRLPPRFDPRGGPGEPPPPRRGRLPGTRLPLLPLFAGLLASLVSAAGLAWYFAKPIRHLRRGFDQAAEGNLAIRVSPGMGGRRDELADLGRDFDRMTERLKAVLDGQKRLLHDVSHEMRSPLARLQAAIGLARQQPARLADSLQRIEREGERMNRLVGELLTLSRLDAEGHGTLENVDMDELLAGIVEDARFEGAARQVGVDYLAPAGPVEVRANPALLHRAIENVVRNALRHSPPGGTLRIESGTGGGGRFRLAIVDQGPGVAESELEAIFKPFVRGGEGGGAGEGYGLGLAIARRVIIAVDGEIRAKNAAGGGLRVEIDLPAAG